KQFHFDDAAGVRWNDKRLQLRANDGHPPMLNPQNLTFTRALPARPWDARLARRLVIPLKDTWVTPNHLTTVRLLVGLAACAAFGVGSYMWSNVAGCLIILSNFLDHTDGELARLSGKTSRFGHIYDLASDALVTILMFIAIGAGIAASGRDDL